MSKTATLPSIVLAGLQRYQTPKSDKKVPTREQRIERLLNKYASAKLTYRNFDSKHCNYNRWQQEFNKLYIEARALIGKDYNNDHVQTGWEGTDFDEATIERLNKTEFVCWTNNPARPWNSADIEYENNALVMMLAKLAKKPCYNIYYDHS
jgi:hypothetical protein